MEDVVDWEEVKEWFGEGEVDVEAMIERGTTTKEKLIKLYLQDKAKEVF
jgi:hypothetical protein